MKLRLLLLGIFIGSLSSVFCSRSKRSAHDAPDYSLVVTDNIQRFIYVIAFIDKTTAEIYHNDPETIRTAIGRSFKTANTYFYQINLRLIVADIILTGREFSTLQDSNEFHNNLRKRHTLPYHNFAIFFNSKIKYNLAWPGQICRPYNGVHIPLNHYNPEESGPEIFEIFAFLTNLSKKEETERLENCRCREYFSRSKHSTTTKHDCLRIPGYPQNCSVQALANKLKTIECIPTKIRTPTDDTKEGYTKDSNDRSLSGLAVCGNGIIEDGEHCDCGFKRYCLNEKHQKHCNQTNCLWNGQHSSLERLSYTDESHFNCECNFIKKVLNERCGRQFCQLDYPIWIIHGVMYSITTVFIFLFCCCFSCLYGRNPSKVYRQSLVFTFDDKPKHKPPPPPASTKPRPVIVLMRPSIPPPAPPTLPKPKALRPTLMSQQLPLPPQSNFHKKENPYDKVPYSYSPS
jgi:hypothetical protein